MKKCSLFIYQFMANTYADPWVCLNEFFNFCADKNTNVSFFEIIDKNLILSKCDKSPGNMVVEWACIRNFPI